MLKTWSGRHCKRQGARARKQLDAQRYNLVLSDLRLPDQDGISLICMDERTWTPNSPIIMTGYADIQSAVQAMKNGATIYLQNQYNQMYR